MKLIIACCVFFALTPAAHATDRYYFDIHVRSQSGQYQVNATSPDKEAFQANFTYKCVDTKSGKTIWTRKQPMQKPQLFKFPNGSFEYAIPKEGSPVMIFVSDHGTAVILTSRDHLIVVSSKGQKVGESDFLKDALTEDEIDQFVHRWLLGQSWSRFNAWYFLDLPGRKLFVIRSGWGRRIFVNALKGKLVQSSQALEADAEEREKKLVMATLSLKEEPDNHELSKLAAAYLAGILKLPEAIPFLRTLEESRYSSSCTCGGNYDDEDFNNEIDPRRYCTYDLRQVTQLSLRRLGVTPKHLPCHSFKLEKDGIAIPFKSTVQERPRHEAVELVEVGMSAREVLNTIGAPDYIDHDTWSYDIDASPPFSLNLTFNARNVTATKKEAPLWKSGLARDEALAF
ncbi:outer membrane protein assembly factor BamE [Gimesia fumaroli]|uniref:Uncharacterized protein n=1 Tax=Gimesia fumaroli TaxID=2527976 RepID=A0A518IFD4_9PLAN|nr:outer membrane protein assembly factor BamE [Gimesia fumaroli]QDV51768.1 hypothetical protein Enr17x_38260 [Gimesia fumaroli]